MHGMIACPITDSVRSAYGKKFKLLSLPASCSSGYIYLRGSNPVGVAMTRTYDGDASNKRWICRPEILDSAVSESGLSKDDILQRMVYDSCYGSECKGTAIQLSGKNDELFCMFADIGDFKFTESPSGSIIGTTTEECVSDAISDDISEECMNSINGMWSLNVLDHHPVRDVINYIEQFADTHRNEILAAYNFAEKKGKYTAVQSSLKMYSILVSYEEYFNDLTQFINAKIDENVPGTTDASVAAMKALDVDDKFCSDLFEREHRAAVEAYPLVAIEIFEAIIAFSNFLYSVYDNFITIQERCNHKQVSPNDLALINVYGYSVSRFVKRFSQELFGVQYPQLIRISNGEVPKSISNKKKEGYLFW